VASFASPTQRGRSRRSISGGPVFSLLRGHATGCLPDANLPEGTFFVILTRCDIAYSTMDRKKLDKLREELDAMRRTQVRASAVESLAAKLGRTLAKRGKHPIWENSRLT